MKAYYYFLVIVKDKEICTVEDPSLNCVRLSEHFMRHIMSAVNVSEDEDRYVLLKSVDEQTVKVNKDFLSTAMSRRHDEQMSPDTVLSVLLKSFEFASTVASENYIAMAAQFPLVVLHPSKKQLRVIKPKSVFQVFSHVFIHLYQFLRVKRLFVEQNAVDECIIIGDKNYEVGVIPCARFVLCCVNNILIDMRSGKILLLKHNCHRPESSRTKFDNNLHQVVNQLMS